MKRVLVKRTGAMGDVIMALTVLSRLRHEFGDQCVIDFDTRHPQVVRGNPYVSLISAGRNSDEYDRLIDLDGAYERRVSINAVDAYFDACFGDSHWVNKQAYLKRRCPKNLPLLDYRNAVVVHGGATWKNRTFPDSFWNSLLQQMVDRGLTPIVVGREPDFNPSAFNPNIINLVDSDVSINEIAFLISISACFCGNDGGVFHIAGTTDTPIVGLFTSVRPELRAPYRHGVLGWKTEFPLPDLSCIGCLYDPERNWPYDGCKFNTFSCIGDDRISVYQVANIVENFVRTE